MSLDLNGAAGPVPTEPEWKSKGSVLKMRVPAPKRNVSAPPQPAVAKPAAPKAKQTPHPKEAAAKAPNPQQPWPQQDQQQWPSQQDQQQWPSQQDQQQWPSQQDQQQWPSQQDQQQWHQSWQDKHQKHQSWQQQQKQSWQQQKQHRRQQQQQQQQQPPQTAPGSSKAGWGKEQPAPSMLERAVPRPPSRASGVTKGSWENMNMASPSSAAGGVTEVQRVAETRGGVLRMSEVRKLADARKDTEGKGPDAVQPGKAAQIAKAAQPVDVTMVVKAAKSKARPPAGGLQQEDQLQTPCLQGRFGPQQPGPMHPYPQPRPPFHQPQPLPHQQQTNQLLNQPPLMPLSLCASGLIPNGPPQAPQQLQQMPPLSKDLYVATSPSSSNDLQSAAENAFQAQILDEQRQEEQAQQLAEMQAEQERKAAEDAVRQRQEHVKQLARAAIEAVKAAQQRAEEAAASAKPLQNAPVEMQESMLQATERSIAVADAAITEAARSMDNTALAISAYDAAGTMEPAEEFWSLNEKLQEARITIDGARPTVDIVHTQLQARKEALERDLRTVFTRYDVDADGYLSRAEVLAFAKGEHGYDLNQEQLERLIASLVGDWLAGVPFENFHQLNGMIATEKGAAQARELDARKAAIHEEMTFATTILKGVEALAGKVKAAAEGLRRHPVSQRKAAAGNVKSGLASGRAKLESSEALTSNLTAPSAGSADDPLDAIVRSFREQALAEFVARVNAVRASLDAAEQSLAAEEIQLQHVGFVEMEELRVKIAYAIRGFMLVRGKTKDQLFEQASAGNATVSLEAFSQFLTTLVEQCPKESLPEEVRNLTASADKVAATFDHLTRSGSAPVDRPRFIRCLVNMRYCAVNGQATLATDTSRMSMRRYLLPGETFEAMDLTEVASPSSPSVRQARVKALSDGAEGWILVAPDAARPSHAALQCVSETILTKAMVAAEGALLRRIQEGELVEALPMDAELSDTAGLVRFRCRTLADSLEGWATLRGNNNRLFFELP